MTIREYIKDNLLILDGAMGSLLQAQGLKPGELPERWNISHPDLITRVHQSYFDAGANVVYANTFGANPLKFGAEELEEIVKAAAENAAKARSLSETAQEKFIALDVGPLGRLLRPYGDLDFEDAVSAFAAVCGLGEKYGFDLIVIETMNDSYETKAALLAAKENSSLPVFVTNAYGEDGKLMTGADPAAMVALLEGMGADAVGVNCSLGPKQLAPIVAQYLRFASVPVIVKPNAGLPELIGGKTVYGTTPEEFAADVAEMVRAGAGIAGGCCGTTPDYIARLRESVKGLPVPAVTEKGRTVVSSYTHAVTFGEKPLLIGERINPTGKKRFRQALVEKDITYILNQGLDQAEKGADILDVNVGLPEIDEAAMIREVVCELQGVTDLPLQIDTADPAAMEAALRRYNGKALINSVNGKEESMRAIFPLVKKYGGVVIALTLDDAGIPATAEARLAVAEKIIACAAAYGISPKDIVFDPLAMTVSADAGSAAVTLDALDLIRKKIGCYTSLGVSNVSFGLPRRDLVNSAFFTMAMDRGLSAAIINPGSAEMIRAYRTFLLLHGLDENCSDYIAFAERYTAEAGPAPAASSGAKAGGPESASALRDAIVKGLRQSAADNAAQMLAFTDPLDLINNEVIPALNTVGIGFENKQIYLPQLLMSAEAAGAAFEKIKAAVLRTGTVQASKCSFVLATVKGDIHDIGKNIVRLLLENYGFSVVDLGRDVPWEAVADKVVELHAPLAGLSALMTTTVPSMAETVRLIHERAPWCKVVVGGAVLNQEYADTMGADKYAKDAMETVRYAEQIYADLG